MEEEKEKNIKEIQEFLHKFREEIKNEHKLKKKLLGSSIELYPKFINDPNDPSFYILIRIKEILKLRLSNKTLHIEDRRTLPKELFGIGLGDYNTIVKHVTVKIGEDQDTIFFREEDTIMVYSFTQNKILLNQISYNKNEKKERLIFQRPQDLDEEEMRLLSNNNSGFIYMVSSNRTKKEKIQEDDTVKLSKIYLRRNRKNEKRIAQFSQSYWLSKDGNKELMPIWFTFCYLNPLKCFLIGKKFRNKEYSKRLKTIEKEEYTIFHPKTKKILKILKTEGAEESDYLFPYLHLNWNLIKSSIGNKVNSFFKFESIVNQQKLGEMTKEVEFVQAVEPFYYFQQTELSSLESKFEKIFFFLDEFNGFDAKYLFRKKFPEMIKTDKKNEKLFEKDELKFFEKESSLLNIKKLLENCSLFYENFARRILAKVLHNGVQHIHNIALKGRYYTTCICERAEKVITALKEYLKDDLKYLKTEKLENPTFFFFSAKRKIHFRYIKKGDSEWTLEVIDIMESVNKGQTCIIERFENFQIAKLYHSALILINFKIGKLLIYDVENIIVVSMIQIKLLVNNNSKGPFFEIERFGKKLREKEIFGRIKLVEYKNSKNFSFVFLIKGAMRVDWIRVIQGEIKRKIYFLSSFVFIKKLLRFEKLSVVNGELLFVFKDLSCFGPNRKEAENFDYIEEWKKFKEKEYEVLKELMGY